MNGCNAAINRGWGSDRVLAVQLGGLAVDAWSSRSRGKEWLQRSDEEAHATFITLCSVIKDESTRATSRASTNLATS
jgi:hypothetical protein